MLSLEARAGHWLCGGEGVTTEGKPRPIAWDAWHRFQVSLDVKSRTFRVLLQVLGEPPRELCRGTIEKLPATDSELAIEMFCRRSKPSGDGPAFDNLRVTR